MIEVLQNIVDFLSRIGINDVIDILIVACLIYQLMKLVTGTKAAQIIKGIAILLFTTLISEWCRFNSVNFILRNTMQVGLIALIILFQPELRRALEKVGRNTLGNFIKSDENKTTEEITEVIRQVCNAVRIFAASKTGAIIVFEKEVNLKEMLIGRYSPVDSLVTSAVLQNIFFPNTPLHDGAVIVKDNRISAANCYLPLTGLESLDQEMGTRHRAGIGITEVSDCISIMVSEETGKISVAQNGKIERGLTVDGLSAKLTELLVEEPEPVEKKKWLKGKVNNK